MYLCDNNVVYKDVVAIETVWDHVTNLISTHHRNSWQREQ